MGQHALTMINYLKPYNPNRTVEQLTEFLLWTTCTAGKSSATITPRFNALIEEQPATSVIRSHGNRIRGLLRKHSIGQYDRLSKAWQTIGLGELDDGRKLRSGNFLRFAHRDDFTIIPGIGLKTASFYKMNTQPWSDVAALDVHILRWLQQEFPKYPVPTQTPQDPDEYARLEAMFLGCASVFNMSSRELDLAIWKQSTNNN